MAGERHGMCELAFIQLCAPFSDMLHPSYVISIHPYQLGVNLEEGNMFNPQKPKKLLSGAQFVVLLSLHINLLPE
jgi:hypothetical protein